MEYLDPLIQMILSLARTPEEAAQLVKQVADVNWHELFALKAHREAPLTEGVCQLCQAQLAMKAMPSHIRTCLQQQEEQRARANSRTRPKFLISVEGLELPQYWGFVEVSQDCRLSSLDAILRRVWLECCGHLSAFTIEGQRYESHDDPEEDWDPEIAENMRIELDRVLQSGMVFDYDYDFGSTTSLTLQVVDTYERKSFRGKAVPFLARNLSPAISCYICGEEAKRVCSQCRESDSIVGRGWYCQRCARRHECGTEMLLPVTNSPRVGVCGYTGKAYQANMDDFGE